LQQKAAAGSTPVTRKVSTRAFEQPPVGNDLACLIRVTTLRVSLRPQDVAEALIRERQSISNRIGCAYEPLSNDENRKTG
jgi:hypothetical protein